MQDRSAKAVKGECTVAARFFAPPPDLAGYLTSIYRLDLTVADGETVVDWLQPEWGNLRVFSGALPWAQVGTGEVVDKARFTVTGPSSRGMRFELGSKPVMRPVGFCDHKKACRVLVDAVHDARTPFATNPRQGIAAMVQQGVHQGARRRPLLFPQSLVRLRAPRRE